MSGRWVDLREAAELLGTSTEAVGKRAVGESLRAEEIQRRDLIIRQLTQANAALAARVPELEAPGTPETAAEASEGAEPRLAAGRIRRPRSTTRCKD
jgi:hypothetical protein